DLSLRGARAASTMTRDKPGIERLRFRQGSAADGSTLHLPDRALAPGRAARHRRGGADRAGTAAPQGPLVHAAAPAQRRRSRGCCRWTRLAAALGVVDTRVR